MASTAKGDTGQSSSAACDGGLSQPPQAGPPEAEEDSQCPICLGPMETPTYVIFCLHKFCCICIRKWAEASDSCPVCRQSMEYLVRSVRGYYGYEDFTIGPCDNLWKRRGRKRDPRPFAAAALQLMEMAYNRQRSASRSSPVESEGAQGQEEAPGPSNTRSQRVPLASHEMTPLREGEYPAGLVAPLEPQNGTE